MGQSGESGGGGWKRSATLRPGRYLRCAAVDSILSEEQPDAIVHFARSPRTGAFSSPEPVIRTKPARHIHLLDAARRHGTPRFLHVSTDEVYGSLAAPARTTESFPLNASSPYSASKAGSDLLGARRIS